MALPTELLDHILSFLQSDKPALRACAKSHPLLSQLTEPHLYAQISLWTCLQVHPPNPNLFGTSNLARLLSKSPRVVHYIRKLDISIYGKYFSLVERRLKEISAFLPRLLALKSISLSSDYSWERLPAYFCQAFWTALRSPSMQHVSISRVINFPLLNVLTREECKITQLTIHDRFYYNWSQSIRTPTKWSSPLESLCLKNCDRWFLNNVTTWLDKSGMQFRSLECSSAWNDSNTFPKLLTSSSNSLTSLDLDIELRKTRMFVVSLSSFGSSSSSQHSMTSDPSHLMSSIVHSTSSQSPYPPFHILCTLLSMPNLSMFPKLQLSLWEGGVSILPYLSSRNCSPATLPPIPHHFDI